MRHQNILLTLGLILALALAACSAVQAAPLSQQDNSTEAPRTISVNGQGRVTLTPDIAYISIGVQTENADAQEAVGENSSQAEGVIAALVRLGVEDKDIRTTNFSIYPRQDYDRDGNPLQTIYVVQNTVQVTVRDLDQVGQALNAVVQAGANNISGIQFDVADRSAAESQALATAVGDARSRAEVLARAADVQLLDVLSISTSLSGGPPPVLYERVVVEMAAAGDVPISPGQMEITVDVFVVYEIR